MNIKCFQRLGGGFTLIELLIVIAIIGLLSTFAFANISSSVAKARDAKRVHDISQIRKVLELYYDKNEAYPVCVTAYIDGTTDCLSAAVIASGVALRLPVDPQWVGVHNGYQYYGDGVVFAIRAGLETKFLPQTHIYPSGSCNNGYPQCGWYQTCVYPGYGALGCEGLTYAVGNQ